MKKPWYEFFGFKYEANMHYIESANMEVKLGDHYTFLGHGVLKIIYYTVISTIAILLVTSIEVLK